MKDIKELSHDELVGVIANMHDTIQQWGNGWGLDKAEFEVMDKVGQLSIDYCNKNTHLWDLSQVK